MKTQISSALVFAATMFAFTINANAQTGNEENLASFKAFLPTWEKAVRNFVNADKTLWKQICSKTDDATIIGGFGGYEKGWDQQVSARYDWAAMQFKNSGTKVDFEYVITMVNNDLAYIVVIERSNPVTGTMTKPSKMELRVTQIFRKENNEWKILHRHADMLIEKKAAE